MTNLSKGSTYSAVVPLTAMVLEPSNLFGYTKYLIWTWTWIWSVMIPIKLVFQMSDFRYEIKNFVTCYLTETLTLQKSRSVRLNEQRTTDPGSGWSGRWWRCWRDRPPTDPSSVSDLGTGLGSSSSNELISAQLCVETPFRPALFSVFSSINWSRLLSSGSGPDSYPVSYWVSYRASYLDLFTQHEPK